MNTKQIDYCIELAHTIIDLFCIHGHPPCDLIIKSIIGFFNWIYNGKYVILYSDGKT